MVDPSGLKEATAFERIHLLGFLYFCDGKLTGLGIRVNDLEWFSSENAIGEHDGHPGEVSPDIKSDREVGDAFKHSEYLLVFHSYPFWQVSKSRGRIHNLAAHTGIAWGFPTSQNINHHRMD